MRKLLQCFKHSHNQHTHRTLGSENTINAIHSFNLFCLVYTGNESNSTLYWVCKHICSMRTFQLSIQFHFIFCIKYHKYNNEQMWNEFHFPTNSWNDDIVWSRKWINEMVIISMLSENVFDSFLSKPFYNNNDELNYWSFERTF